MSHLVPERILVVCTRRIGDVLLATPLIHSLRLAYPQSLIDVLVFAGTAGVLSGNPDVSKVIPVAERSPWRGASARLAASVECL
jgi:heptosyltransferase III